MADRKMTKVACTVPNGIKLHLWKQGFLDGTGDGERPIIKDGEPEQLAGPSPLDTGAGATERTDLAPGITEIDAEWWAKWTAQNELNPLFTNEAIFEVKDE